MSAAAERDEAEAPLTLGTAGHVDHGKTSLVAALTGLDTDRLPEEKARGLTIALGYAPLELPSGRRLSLVDVPGHERFVRTMVAGATGVDMYLMVVAADDGAMPQTVEHAAVLDALGVRDGVVAVTKADLADPGRAAAEAAELLPGAPVVPCSARTGEGLGNLLDALEVVAARVPSRGGGPGPALLHIDRVFTIRGRGTVVTGTLWSGSIAQGDALCVEPSGIPVRVRGVQVHDAPAQAARAGQRVAVNVVGASREQIAPGDALAAPGTITESRVLDCALELRSARHGERVQAHHGTRSVAARVADLGEDLWQLRLERPLLARDGDRLVIRRLAPPDTLGGGRILDSSASRHGKREETMRRLRALRAGEPAAPPAPRAMKKGAVERREPQERDASGLLALERRLRDAGAGLLSEAQLAGDDRALAALRAQGRAVRVSGRLYAHADVAAQVRDAVLELLDAEGSATLAEVRDALGLSRKSTQAFLEYLDAARLTRRLPDDRRVRAARRAPAARGAR